MDDSQSLNPFELEKVMFRFPIRVRSLDPEQKYPYAFLIGGRVRGSALVVFDVVPIDVFVLSKGYDGRDLMTKFLTWKASQGEKMGDDADGKAFGQAIVYIGARPDIHSGELSRPRAISFTHKAFTEPFRYAADFCELVSPY